MDLVFDCVFDLGLDLLFDMVLYLVLGLVFDSTLDLRFIVLNSMTIIHVRVLGVFDFVCVIM